MIQENIGLVVSQLEILESQIREVRSVLLSAKGSFEFFEREEISLDSGTKKKLVDCVKDSFAKLQDESAILVTLYKATEDLNPKEPA